MIGWWARRNRAAAGSGSPQRGKWHLVESVVAGDVITRCGRRMAPPLEYSEVEPLTRLIGQPQNCKRCS